MQPLVLASPVVLFAALMTPPQGSDISPLAAATRLIPFRTLTLSDEQFLRGDEGGKEETIAGQLRIAQGEGRLPTVILVHGSSGMRSNIELWSRAFNRVGISTFALDGFTGRGMSRATPTFGRLNMILDAYRALAILADHPRVDPARIVLMGFSRGGQTALYASLTRFHRAWNTSGAEFAAYIPFYPRCSTTYQLDTALADVPVRIFHGTADEGNPLDPCRAYVERLRAAGNDVVLTEYEGAHHAFDDPTLGTMPTLLTGRLPSWCDIREESPGRLVNADTDRPLADEDACVRPGYHIGHDPAATEAARRAVVEFLTALFELN